MKHSVQILESFFLANKQTMEWSDSSPIVVLLWLLCLILRVRLGKNGAEEVLGLGALSDYEKQGLEALLPELKSSIEKGIKFANQS